MAYNKEGVLRVGDAAYQLFLGLSNGVDQEEIMNLVNLLTNAVSVSQEFQNDFDAAAPHVLSRILELVGDKNINPEVG